MTSPCPPDDLLRRLRDDDLDADRDVELERHVESCPECTARMESMGRRFSTEGPSGSGLPAAGAFPRLPGLAIECELGRGGMGVVYRARQEDIGRTVAVKVLSGADARRCRRWRNEASAAASVSHPNVVQVHSAGEVERLFFLVMEYVGGGSLRDRADAPTEPRRAAETVRDVARTVAHFHAKGLVHLDLTPANILVDEATGRPVPKVADFGLARTIADDPGGVTRDGVRGTPSYMAPEQTIGDGSAIGPPADVYALGATLYHLLTGRPPLLAAHDLGTMEQVRDHPPVPPRRLAPGIPPDLETIALKCLEKSPQARYPSAAAVADDLDRWLDGRPIEARPAPKLRRAWLAARRRPRIVATCVALAIGLTTGLGVWAELRRRSDAEEAELIQELAYLVGSAEYQVHKASPFQWDRFESTVELIRGRIRRLTPARKLAPEMVVGVSELEGITAERLIKDGRLADAHALTRERLDLIRTRIGVVSDNAWHRRVIVGAFINAAALERASGSWALALDFLDRAVEVMTGSARCLDACRSLALLTSAEYAGLQADLGHAGDASGAARAATGLERSREILASGPGDHFDAVVLKACALADAGEWERARDLAEGLLATDPDWSVVDLLLHQSAHEALKAWTRREILRLRSDLDRGEFDPTTCATELDRRLMIMAGLTTRAGRPLDDVCDAIGELMASVGTSQRREGRIDDAERTAAAFMTVSKAMVRRHPEAANCLYLLAEVHVQESKNARRRDDARTVRRGLEAAVRTLQEAIALAPNNEFLWLKLGLLSSRLAELPHS